MPVDTSIVYRTRRTASTAYTVTGLDEGYMRPVRWVLEITLADADPLLAGFTYVELDGYDEIVIDQTGGETAYADNFPVGLPDTPTYTFNIRYDRLPANLQEGITTANALTAQDADGNDVIISSLWVLRTDDGDDSLSEDEFRVEFAGVHQRGDSASYAVASDGTTMTITLVDVMRAALENIPVARMGALMLSRSSEINAGSYTTFSDHYLWQVLVKTTATPPLRYGYAQHDVNSWAVLFSIHDFFLALREVAQNTLDMFTRRTGARTTPNGAEEYGLVWNGTPQSESCFTWKSDYTPANGRGAAVGFGDRMFVGLICDKADEGSADYEDYFGGHLAGDGDGIARHKNMWVALPKLCETFCNRIRFDVAYQAGRDHEWAMTTLRIFDDVEVLEIAPTDIVGEWTVTTQEDTVYRCRVAMTGPGDPNRSDYTTDAGTGTEKSRTAELAALVHTVPTMVTGYTGDDSWTPRNNLAHIAGNSITFTQGPLDIGGLYYVSGTVTGVTTRSIAVLCNGYRIEWTSDDTIGEEEAVTLPDYPNIADGGPWGPATLGFYLANLIRPLEGGMLDRQDGTALGGVASPYVQSRVITSLMGRNVDNVLSPAYRSRIGTATLKGKVPISIASATAAGKGALVTGFATAFPALTPWVGESATLRGVIVAARPDIDEGTTELEILILDASALNPPG